MSLSVSVVVTAAPTAVSAAEFSAMERVAVSAENSGSTFLSWVLPSPGSDQELLPWEFFACTRAS